MRRVATVARVECLKAMAVDGASLLAPARFAGRRTPYGTWTDDAKVDVPTLKIRRHAVERIHGVTGNVFCGPINPPHKACVGASTVNEFATCPTSAPIKTVPSWAAI